MSAPGPAEPADSTATSDRPIRPLRIAALVKQIPAFEHMELTDDGRLQRDGVPLEMSAFCRRAVAEGVRLAGQTGGTCTVITVGPPAAEAVLREALAYGADTALHLCDPAFAGSDTLATARTLAAALTLDDDAVSEGGYDLVLVGRNSVDAETGQVGPELAQLLDLPFAAAVKQLELVDGGAAARVGCEQDDAWIEATVALPAVLSTAERLIDPCKVKDAEALAAVAAERIRLVRADDLGPGPWGQAGSPTRVGAVRTLPVRRMRQRLEGPVDDQVATLVEVLSQRGLLDPPPEDDTGDPDDPPGHRVPDPARPPDGSGASAGSDGPAGSTGPVVAVLVEQGRQRVLRELLGGAADLAHQLGGRVSAIGPNLLAPEPSDARVGRVLRSWGADEVVLLEADPATAGTTTLVEEDVAAATIDWARTAGPTIVLAPATAWGREVAARLAAELGAGMTGDAIGLALAADPGPGDAPGVRGGRLVADKPAFGGALVAAIEAISSTQVATVRPGVLDRRTPRADAPVPVTRLAVKARGRVTVQAHRRDDELDVLTGAHRIVSIGRGVDVADHPRLEALARRLGAELAATRKVTDAGWLPHARQVGITGQNLAPELAVVIGASGKFNHMVGLRRSGVVVAVNPDPEAPVFDVADYGLVAAWEPVVEALERQLDGRTP